MQAELFATAEQATKAEAPQWAQLLADAVSRPGSIHSAYAAFWDYSAGNQLLAMFQCLGRGIAPGPINTFVGWKELGRYVRKGEKAITLCMPVSCKRRSAKDDDADDENPPAQQGTFTRFTFKARWFVLAQTDGAEYRPDPIPGWNEAAALAALEIRHVPFDLFAGNIQGYALRRQVSVSPIAFAPKRTLFHEIAHVLLGHTAESGTLADDDKTPTSLAEVEAESVALIVCESLGMGGVEHSRGYIQTWLRGDTIPERSAQRVFKAADQILKAGRSKSE
jgi:antirestriction protein ArdC